MTRRQWARRVLLAVAAVAGPGLLVVGGLSPEAPVRVGLVVLAVLAVDVSVRLAAAAIPRPAAPVFAAVSRGSSLRPPEPPPGLERWQRAVDHGALSAGGWHFHLRPALRDLVAELVHDGHGIVLDEDPGAARRLLGDRVWERLRFDVADPADRWAPGLSPSELDEIIRRIELLEAPRPPWA